MKEHRITHLPSYQETKREMGIEDYEDYDSDRVRYQQGYNMREFYVQPGETFEITSEHEDPTFQCEEQTIQFKSKFPEIENQSSDQHFGLVKGVYLLSNDGKVVELIEYDEIY